MAKIFVNRVIRTLVQADLLFLSAFGLVDPIFAVFITNQIRGGDVKLVGFAAAIYWISKSILQIPISRYLDKTKGEKDDFHFLIFGFLIAAIVPFGYIFSYLPWHIYVLQFIYSIGMAMAVPAWYAIYTRHINKGEEAFSWSLDSTALGVGIGLTGAIGGILVDKLGFNTVFIMVGIFAIIGGLLPLLIRKEVIPKTPIYLKIFRLKDPFFRKK